ncbi:MAG: condensation domain-containing protein, partial [Methylocystis sp.]
DQTKCESASFSLRHPTTAEEGVYLAHLLDTSRVAYNAGHYKCITGQLDCQLLSQAFDIVLRGVSSYRSVIQIVGNDLKIKIYSAPMWGLRLLDFSHERAPKAAALLWIENERLVEFDLEVGPLFNFTVLKLTDTEFILFHWAHHLIVDAAGKYQFERWVFETYKSLIECGRADALQNESDSAVVEQIYKNSDQFNKDQNFWKSELNDVPTQISLSGEGSVADRCFTREVVSLPTKLSENLNYLCRKLDVTKSRVLIAIGALYYARMTGQKNIIIDIPVSLRLTKEDRLAVDFRSNIIHLKLQVDPQLTIKEFVDHVASRLRICLNHKQYRFEEIKRNIVYMRDVTK